MAADPDHIGARTETVIGSIRPAAIRLSRAAGEEWVTITSSLASDMTAADHPMVQPSFPAETRSAASGTHSI
jgi:hypothetical protein